MPSTIIPPFVLAKAEKVSQKLPGNPPLADLNSTSVDSLSWHSCSILTFSVSILTRNSINVIPYSIIHSFLSIQFYTGRRQYTFSLKYYSVAGTIPPCKGGRPFSFLRFCSALVLHMPAPRDRRTPPRRRRQKVSGQHPAPPRSAISGTISLQNAVEYANIWPCSA